MWSSKKIQLKRYSSKILFALRLTKTNRFLFKFPLVFGKLYRCNPTVLYTFLLHSRYNTKYRLFCIRNEINMFANVCNIHHTSAFDHLQLNDDTLNMRLILAAAHTFAFPLLNISLFCRPVRCII